MAIRVEIMADKKINKTLLTVQSVLRFLAASDPGLRAELLETWRRGLTQYAKLQCQEVREVLG